MKALALTALALCAITAPAWAGPKEDLMAADKAFSDLSVAKGNNAAFLAYMTDDARTFGTGGQPPMFSKKEAVKRFSDPANGNGDPKVNVLSWAPDHAEVSGDGTLGYTDGRWLFRGKDGKAGAFKLTGHYVTVWRKTASGWKYIADMGTNDPKK